MSKDIIKRYKLKNGQTRYYFQLYLGIDPISEKPIKTTRRGFKTIKEAKLEIARLKVSFEAGTHTTLKKRMKFKEVYELWLPIYETTVKESTFQVQSDVIRLHILPHFGNLYVDRITTAYCQEQTNNWHSYYKKYSNVIGLTQRILEYARLNLKLINDNPMNDVVRPKKKQQLEEDVYEAPNYDKKQLNHFLSCVKQMEQQAFVVFRIIAFTGMREGEVCGLRWSDFDEVNQTLSVKRTVARGKGYKKIIQPPKSLAGNRTIALDDETVKILRNWKREQRKNMLAYGFNTNSPNQYIITNKENEFQYAQYPYALLKSARKKFEFDPITVHGLRHTHCTLSFQAGATLKEMQDRMGHEDEDMVLKIYLHVNQEAKAKIGNQFAAFLAQ